MTTTSPTELIESVSQQDEVNQYEYPHGYQHAPSHPEMTDKAATAAPSHPPNTRQHGVHLGWMWELISIIASAGCTVAVIAILASMQNRPLSHWTFFISINATVAVLITAAESTAFFVVASCISQFKWMYFLKANRQLGELDLFDGASRGPLGALKLLLSVRSHVGIASIGAVVTVLMVAVPAFAQQLISFYSMDVETPNSGATFGLCSIYDGGTKYYRSVGMGLNGFQASTADIYMEGAVFLGIFNMSSQGVFNCTSRCAWKDSYESLGVASSCADVTTQTVATGTVSNTTTSIGNGNAASNATMTMTTPGGIKIQATYVYISDYYGFGVTAVNIAAKEEVDSSSPEIARVAVLRVNDTSTLNQTTDGTDIIGQINSSHIQDVFECTISLVAHRYSNVTASGNQFTVGTLETIQLNRSEEGGYQDGKAYTFFNQSDLTEILGFSTADVLALQNLFISNRFSGIIWDGSELPPNASQAGVGNALRNANISQAFDNMAKSMSDRLRSTYNGTAEGVTLESVVFVRVQWEWLSLPCVVQIATSVLLLLICLRTRDDVARLWKDSTVAVLYHWVVEQPDGQATMTTGLHNRDELKQLACRIRAKLE